MNALATKYRPETFDEVVGQDSTVRALKSILAKRSASSFLFSGYSGCGKTTLARIAAAELGCIQRDILEIDAATNTGVDSMRLVQEGLRFKPMSKGTAKAVIVDECHMLSKAAWNSILKVVEEPPKHVFWFFCTTEPGKVPKTIKTRCAAFSLKQVAERDLIKVVLAVADAEGMRVKNEVLNIIVREADGSPRQALVNLATCAGVRTREEAAELLRTAIQSQPVLELCRFLLRPGSWSKAMAIVGQIETESPESVRIIVTNYMAKVAAGAKGDKQAVQALAVLEAFSQSYNASDKTAPLLLSIGRVLFDG